MTLLATVTIPQTVWVWPAAILALAATGLLVWTYRRSPRNDPAGRIAFVAKLLGVFVLTMCLIEPLWSGRRAKSGANLFVVIADNSASMNIRDPDSDRTRGEILRDALDVTRTDWLAALADSFQFRMYTFDSRLRRTSNFSELTFEGAASTIGAALQAVGERYRDRPLAGVLLMTDGNATDGLAQSADPSGEPPVYPVVIGRDRAGRDLSVANVSVSQTAFEDAPVIVQADIEAAGFAGQIVAVELTDESGGLVERQTWKVSKNDERQVFRFRVRPSRAGILFYQVRVARVLSDDASDPTASHSEATLANNARTVVVDRGEGPYRILYVAGRPNWEYKFLQRAVSEDDQVQMVGLIRVARREPKYDWRGRSGEQSNPLYRGFDNQDREETEAYDQPVLVRLNTRDAAELQEGFPKTAELLFGYHAVILDDIEAAFFTHDQMDLLRRFVTERGGGFFMLGGKDSFREGGFDRTPISSILPVYLDRVPQNVTNSTIRITLTREGWLEPWTRLRDNEQAERERLGTMPDFRVLNRVRSTKAAARTVGTIGGDGAEGLPALIVQRIGHGRSAALTVGDIWRWGMQSPEAREDMNKFWRQTLRWLVADVPGRISLQVADEPDRANDVMPLRVRVRSESFEPMDSVSVAVEVDQPQGQTLRLTATPAAGESGLFESAYVPRVSGGYRARAVVTGPDGIEIGRAQAGWATDLEAREFRSIKANRPLLEQIARQTGGRVVEIDELERFARSLPNREAPISEFWVRPLWDLPGVLPAVFLLVVLCLAVEWTLRRWKGMP
ncbi:glutamine amidotransferase [Anaerobaca lacustris]|uniref:Glutamine amidotransferase n=1 Tax=Anaerobaca lacustris TaxID=3044600 RepID=A0AAW6TW66_9BACT|nr:glutamine amidotransferase [Sedimentisphaerales bacterium M17dextr]